MNIIKHAAFTVLCAAATTLALADEAPSLTITIHQPMDAAHAAQLYEHIRSAAQQVCAPLDAKELTRKRLYTQCVNQAVAGAVAQARSSLLTEVHLSHVHADQTVL